MDKDYEVISINNLYALRVYDKKDSFTFGKEVHIFEKETNEKIRKLGIGRNNSPWFFRNDETLIVEQLKEMTEGEIAQLIKDNRLTKLYLKDIWTKHIGISEEDYCIKTKGYDKRTEEFLAKYLEDLGLLEERHGWDEEELDATDRYRLWLNVSDVEIGNLKDGRYLVQYSQRTAIDDYDITRLYFNKYPSKEDIQNVELVNYIDNYFVNHLPFEFNCWECGTKTHWLDIPGTIREKFECLQDRYCNRC